MKLSVAISTYEYHGKGAEFLEKSFNQLEIQTFKDFDVVISDDSKDDNIENLCNRWVNRLNIIYYRNSVRGAAANTNNSIEKSTGELIKILCGDDYLFDDKSLEYTMAAFDEHTNWLATAYLHTTDRENLTRYHLPAMNPKIHLSNTLGTPSCITLRNSTDLPKIDEVLTYCYDCDFYKRYTDKYGIPKIIDCVTVVNYLWWGSVTSATTKETIDKEFAYIRDKYGY